MSILDLIQHNRSQLEMFSEPVRVIGIDLGTTNSTVAEVVYDPACVDDVTVRCLAIEQPTGNRSHWSPLVPSIVALHNGQEFVGEGARKLRFNGRMEKLGEKRNLFSAVKNDMGLQKTYDMAPQGYRNAAEVSGRILSFLKEAAMKDKSLIPDRTIVTVPASFQLDQRSHTLRAATLAGINLKGGDLLDEPVAAFIGYLSEHPEYELVEPGEAKTLLVFDFGGGTCDVAVFRLASDDNGQLSIATLAVSRYHRLGGGDIDLAILYEHLMPLILEENELHKHELDFDIKKNVIEPAFIGVAEELKTGLCDKITEACENGDEYGECAYIFHGEHQCRLPDGRLLTLTNPAIDVQDFEELLVPFLETYLLFNFENEYRQSLSIFAPIQDAIERSGLAEEDIDLCLLAGGSCLIPQVRMALEEFFYNAELLTFENADSMQTAIARGAALNAIAVALTDTPIIQPVCQETISIVTSNGHFDLVPQGVPLPWPAHGGYEEVTTLALPETSLLEPVSVHVQVVTREDEPRPLVSELWHIPAPVSAGERIRLEYRYDESQVLEIRLSHTERDDVVPFVKKKDHPLTHMANPQKIKLRIEETEEKLRTGEIEPEKRYNAIISIACDCAEVRQYEKAISKLKDLQRKQGKPDASLVNRMGLFWGSMGNIENEVHCYCEASKIDPTWSTPWFNLAHTLKNQKRFDEARDAIDMAIKLKPDSAPSYVIQAQIARDMGKEFAMYEFLEIAFKRFKPLKSITDWELGWYLSAAEMSGDAERVKGAKQERQRRAVTSSSEEQLSEGILPALVA